MAYSTSTLAAGCFGKIYREKYNDSWAAIKKVPQHLINRRDLDRECQVYNKAVHPNIVKLLGNPILKDSKWIIPMEFIFGEDLETTIFKSQKSQIQLTPSIKATIITGMCEGLHHLHSKDIVHQDLKPDNIMVEHETHRAVIIDMGLAKFSRNGLSSAMNMGNEAYSPPEVLQMTSQRDQRSDVWAMGKIIAELCARVRLHTPSVCPAKIQETLSHQGQQYRNAVCRMVQIDPRMRATMAEVIPEIRRAGGTAVPAQLPRAEVKDAYLLPQAPGQRSPSPSRFQCANLPQPDDKPIVRAPVREPSPSRWQHAALPKPEVKMTLLPDPPLQRSPSPSRFELAASPKPEVKITPTSEAPVQQSLSPSGLQHNSPQRPDVKTIVRAPVRAPSPSRWERAALPKPEVKMILLPDPPLQRSPSPSRFELAASPKPEVKKSPTPCPKVPQGKAVGRVMAQPSPADMKQLLYKEASKGFPCPLPQTGNVKISLYMETDGEVESWEQKEVETKGGRIVKFEDIKFNMS